MLTSEDQNDFVKRVFDAARSCDYETFLALIENNKSSRRLNSSQLEALVNFADPQGNTLFHELLSKNDRFQFRRQHRRNVKVHMLLRLLQEQNSAKAINLANFKGETPLHLAIRNGYDVLVVKRLLEANAHINVPDNMGQTPLDLAANLQRKEIYKTLLHENHSAIKNLNLENSYTCEQLEAASFICKKRLREKNRRMGEIGTILSISCPVGAVLALPLIGVGGALLMGGLLFWTFHDKASWKYGSHAQEIVELETTRAKVDRLEAELNYLKRNEPVKEGSDHYLLNRNKLRVIEKLSSIYKTVKTVEPIVKADHSDWNTTSDVLQAYLSSAAGFLCAFSGVLGILGIISGYLPAISMLSVACLGVPLGGWLALGIAIGVGIVVGYVYHSKVQDSLEEKSKVRKELHKKELGLSEKKTAYISQNQQQHSRVSGYISSYAGIQSLTHKAGAALCDSEEPTVSISLARMTRSMPDSVAALVGTQSTSGKQNIKGMNCNIPPDEIVRPEEFVSRGVAY